jgi:tetratricopeptide (TPR) repeat protein
MASALAASRAIRGQRWPSCTGALNKALKRYKEGWGFIEWTGKAEAKNYGFEPPSAADLAQLDRLKAVIQTNIAGVYLALADEPPKEEKRRMEVFKRAADAAAEALSFDRTNVKAMYRRAFACTELNRLDEAHLDLTAALALEPKDAKLRALAVEHKRKASMQRQIDKEVYLLPHVTHPNPTVFCSTIQDSALPHSASTRYYPTVPQYPCRPTGAGLLPHVPHLDPTAHHAVELLARARRAPACAAALARAVGCCGDAQRRDCVGCDCEQLGCCRRRTPS